MSKLQIALSLWAFIAVCAGLFVWPMCKVAKRADQLMGLE
jgi:hypothetical protein